MNTVLMIDQAGEQYDIPQDKVKDAIGAGLKPAGQGSGEPSRGRPQSEQPTQQTSEETVELYDRDGNAYDIPASRVNEAFKSGLMVRSVSQKGTKNSKPVAAFFQGAGQGLTMGAEDELEGGIQGTWNWATKWDGKSLADNYREQRDEARQRDTDLKDSNPLSYGTGKVTGVVGSALIPGGLAARGVVGATKAGAAYGAAAGWGNSDADNFVDLAKDTGKGALFGAAGGAAAPLVGRGMAAGGATMSKAAEATFGRAAQVLNNVTGKTLTQQQVKMAAMVYDLFSHGGAGTASYFATKGGAQLLKKAGEILAKVGGPKAVANTPRAASVVATATNRASSKPRARWNPQTKQYELLP